jgi:hypothetical protein
MAPSMNLRLLLDDMRNLLANTPEYRKRTSIGVGSVFV